MATNWSDVYVKCPFFKSEKANDLSCENIISGGVSCRHRFATKREKTQHMERCCFSRYKKCVYYRVLLSEKYSNELSG